MDNQAIIQLLMRDPAYAAYFAGQKGGPKINDAMRAYVNLVQSGFADAQPYVSGAMDKTYGSIGPGISSILQALFGR